MPGLTARLLTRLAAVLRPRPPRPPVIPALTQPPRTPDPYVWTLPNLHDTRRRRGHRRTHNTSPAEAAAFLRPEEACWQPPVRSSPRSQECAPYDDVVRLYVVQALGEEPRPAAEGRSKPRPDPFGRPGL
ncbi:hypothetical protein ACOT81_20310 [Streptomyces sp. WI04-05B]|uniref:hypothetical protein n=1 Tax=Streptomyces TaxID=1883 RepID=UPI0029B29967|nr:MULTISPECIES: hypothetical protein [unclassified Streptomyces]MDX2544714.1 hypothetical protein [Streptomyces sp. WI04-05B]MDX2588760.1 hypothetical protein [Streptomyces sp. WI04-05A]MDX3749685.1 hypothetical protein [Streptomyces sp. AK08-02]